MGRSNEFQTGECALGMIGDCGLCNVAPMDGSFRANPDLRKPYARHLGGVTVGFLDGHTQWIGSEHLIAKVADGEIQSLWPWVPSQPCSFGEDCPGVPALFQARGLRTPNSIAACSEPQLETLPLVAAYPDSS